jgi:hypothetical protein
MIQVFRDAWRETTQMGNPAAGERMKHGCCCWLVLLTSMVVPSSATCAVDFPPDADAKPAAASPMPAAKAAAKFRVPAGFRVTTFAAEPDVCNPVAMAWDARGRLWIAENYTYSDQTQKFDLRLRDRVLIFEDTDGDGRFDRRTVFTEEVQRLASVELGFGGVWLLCPPQLQFIPRGDRAAGHSRGRTRADPRRPLALSTATKALRGRLSWHDQPVGT